MKRYLYYFVLIIVINVFIGSTASAATVTVEPIHSRDGYQAGGSYPVLFRLKIEKTFYIHGAEKGEDFLIPTKLSFQDSPQLKLEKIVFPEPEKRKFDYTSSPVPLYSGDILVKATLTIDGKADSGNRTIKGNLSYQACSSNACLPPENVKADLSVMIVPDDIPVNDLNKELFLQAKGKNDTKKKISIAGSGAGLLFTLLTVFLGGLVLNLTPCVYPLIPVTVSYFGGKSEKMRNRTVLHGAVYLFGLSVTNSVLGVASAISGGMLGFALQNPAVLIVIACIIAGMGLSFFGLWELRVPGGLARAASKSYRGYFGTFFMGLTFGVVAAPCVGPFILGLLTYVGQLGDPFLGFLYFFILSIGMGLPLCVLAVFSGTIDRLPMSGDWMVWVRKFMGWVLMGMAVYIIIPLVYYSTARATLFLMVAAAAGIHLGWLDRTGKDRGWFSYIKKISGVILIACGLIYFASAVHEEEVIDWVPYKQAVMSNAVREGRPMLFDLYADWCLPCKELDKKVFSDPEVVKLSRKFLLIRLDLTTRKPFQDEILRRYNVKGVPTVIFINREGREERDLRVEEIISRSAFLIRMKKLLDR